MFLRAAEEPPLLHEPRLELLLPDLEFLEFKLEQLLLDPFLDTLLLLFEFLEPRLLVEHRRMPPFLTPFLTPFLPFFFPLKLLFDPKKEQPLHNEADLAG